MAYIYLEELKKILPGILDQWIDEDDESWEWIFQEIEQKCHVGKRCKGKNKKWRKKLDSMVDTHSTVLSAHRNDINELSKKVDELKKYATDNLNSRINTLFYDVSAAKSMAQTAKQRTEVDYSKYSGKSDGEIIYSKDCETCKYNGSVENSPCILCNNNCKWEAKEIPIEKICMTCKYDCESGCIYSGDLCGIHHEHWEAKDGVDRKTT